MRRVLVLASVALLAGAAGAQNAPKPAAAPNAPAAAKEPSVLPGNAPLNAPAAAKSPAPAAADPGSAATAKTITIRVPSGTPYTAYIREAPTSSKSISDKGELDVPEGGKPFTVYVLDTKSGYAARKTVDKGDTKELSFSSPDFKLLQKVQVKVTGKDSKPIAGGVITLTDGAKTQTPKPLSSSSQGTAEFDFPVSGAGKVTVSPQGGSSLSQDVTLDLPKGETVQVITIPMPNVTATVEPVGGTPAANSPAAGTPAAPAAGSAVPAAAPAAAPAAPARQLPPPETGGGWAQNFLGFIFLVALIGGGVMWARSRGVTVESLMKQAGTLADTGQGGGVAAAPGYAPAPGPAPAPPPVVSDPNQCQFCGQLKDMAGNCACSVVGGAQSAPSAAGMSGFGAPGGGSGPRLVGMAGTYMGTVFPISGAALIGRDATNPVPLDRDTTTSRRHAQITASGGGYHIQDLGSSNGTFVNGARITEAQLAPGDEVSIGATRFRFEA